MRITHTLACGLLIAIFFVVIQSPSREQSHANPKTSIESLLDRLAKNDEAMMTLIAQHGEELASVEDCHKADSEAVRTQLVSLQEKVEKSAEVPAESSCDCDCQAEIDALKKRVEALEKLCQAKPMVSNYGPSPSSSSGGGSVGSTASGLGSVGSRVTPVQQSYGSTGSAVVSAASPAVSYGSTGSAFTTSRQVRTPLRNVAAVVTSPIARAGHWSYPGKISNHLAADHAVSAPIPGYTPARAPIFQRSQPVQQPVQLQSDCPNGQCPIRGNTQSTQSNSWFLGKNLGRQR